MTMADSAKSELEKLLNEDFSTLMEREQGTFAAEVPGGMPLVLFGAGNLGRKTLAGLRQVGLETLAFADNRRDLWNTVVDGLKVWSPQEAAREYGADAAFLVTIWGAQNGARFAQIKQQLQDLHCRTVALFASLYWKFPDIFLPYFHLDLPHRYWHQREQIKQGFDLWEDEPSCQEYLAHMRWRWRLDYYGLPRPVPVEQYFPDDLIELSREEVFVDCGAFDGDTIQLFLHRVGDSFQKIFAFEPDPLNFQKLQDYTLSLPEHVRSKMVLLPLALGTSRDRKSVV